MGSQIKLPPPDQHLIVDVRAPGEWIVHAPAGGRSLHIYMLEPDDWLVSEVGLGNEGRGVDLKQALRALSAGAERPDWWDAAATALSPSTI
ncbi:MAG TPA: hypothetical protein VFD88_00355 [Clostridia bacterium]|nr:hypothetical protein [Clostridia bacterium]